MGRGGTEEQGTQGAAGAPKARRRGPRVTDVHNRTIDLGSAVLSQDGTRYIAKDFHHPRDGVRKVVLIDDENYELTVWAEETTKGNFKLSAYRLAPHLS